MLIFVIIFLISCGFTNATPYEWQIERTITEALYNPYISIQGTVDPEMEILWRKELNKSDKMFFQAYYLHNNEYKFVYYSLCDAYPKNSMKKLFQDLTYYLFTAKKSCPVKKGIVTSPSSFNITTNVKPLPECGQTTVQINGYGPEVSVQYFSHFLYVVLETTVTGGDCYLKNLQ